MPIDVAATIATLRTVAGVLKESGKIDLYQKIIDLQQSTLDAIAENTKLAVDNAKLSREIEELRAEEDKRHRDDSRRRQMVFRDNAYWDGADQSADGPFCPKCLDSDQKYVRMIALPDAFTCCVGCNFVIGTPGYVQTQRSPRGYYEGGIPLDF